MKNDADEAALATLLDALQSLQNRDHMHVRESAASAFHSVATVDGLLKQLERARRHSEEGAVRP